MRCDSKTICITPQPNMGRGCSRHRFPPTVPAEDPRGLAEGLQGPMPPIYPSRFATLFGAHRKERRVSTEAAIVVSARFFRNGKVAHTEQGGVENIWPRTFRKTINWLHYPYRRRRNDHVKRSHTGADSTLWTGSPPCDRYLHD